MNAAHLPVLADEVMSTLAPAPGSLHIDSTLGGGGHTERILEATDPDGRLLGLDADGAAVARVRERLGAPVRRPVASSARRTSASSPRSRPTRASPMPTAACSTLVCPASSSPTRDRGFGFRAGGPLDMRFDASRGVPAAELLATLTADELTALFRRYGEEPKASRIARAIVGRPADGAGLDRRGARRARRAVVPPNPRIPRRTHPATRVFQALRIAVNEELEALQAGLAAALDLLRPGGRLVVLSYHSLEDRIVKRFFQAERRGCVCPPEVPICVCGRNPRLRLITRPSLTPTAAEIDVNPRARSARLRAAERLAA